MKIFPSKSQWRKWSLPGKASYISAWLGGIGLLITIVILIAGSEHDSPVVSILSLDSLLHEDSMETKFSIKNAGNKPVFLAIKGEAFIGGRIIETKSRKIETQIQTIMPGQVIKYRGLTIKGSTYKEIIGGKLIPEITQTVSITYGSSEKKMDEHYVFQKVRLDLSKLANLKERSQTLYGLWLLEESRFK